MNCLINSVFAGLRRMGMFFPFLFFLLSLFVFSFVFSQEGQRGHTSEADREEDDFCKDSYHPTFDELRQIFERAIMLQGNGSLCRLSGLKSFESISESSEFKTNDGYSGPVLVTSVTQHDEDGLAWDSEILTFREGVACLNRTKKEGHMINYKLESSSGTLGFSDWSIEVHERNTVLVFNKKGQLILVNTVRVDSTDSVLGRSMDNMSDLQCGDYEELLDQTEI